jgi:choline transport protein
MAPRSYRRYLSYITGGRFRSPWAPDFFAHSDTGYLCAITWQTGVAGTAFVAGTLIQSLFVLNIPSYNPHPWHGTLLTIAFVIIAAAFNTFLARKLPIVENVFLFMHILGILIFIPLWIMAPRSEGGSPIVDFYNQNGWASNGLATMVATVGPSAALTGFDCSVHMGISISELFLAFSCLITT